MQVVFITDDMEETRVSAIYIPLTYIIRLFFTVKCEKIIHI
jgi:hypothetical protein